MIMQRYRRPFLLLAAILLSTAWGCANSISTIQRIDAPRTQMTVKQAQKALVESLQHQIAGRKARNVKFNRDRVDFKIIEEKGKTKGSVVFAEVNNLELEAHRWTYDNWCGVNANHDSTLLLAPNRAAVFENKDAALQFIDAVLTLKQAQLAPSGEADTEETDFASFVAGADRWLATTPRPAMSDDARAYKALAEDAFKRKDFAAALDAYAQALERYPTWPDGQYNAALLAAENEDYAVAAQHMRRYLVLAPSAKDAVAAKDKLLLWQLKAKQ